MIKTKKYLDIEDVDRSESNYAISGRYYKVDPKEITFEDWVKKSLNFDQEVDFTYWEFDRKIEGDLANKLTRSNKDFKQKKYIITNRRVVHVFNNDQKFHRSIHTRPDNLKDFIMGIYRPTRVKFFPKTDKSPDAYMIRNNMNDVKSYLNVHDKKIMKIQTSFLNEEFDYIFDIREIITSDISLFDFDQSSLNEAEDNVLNDKYKLLGKWIYTVDPNLEVERINEGILLQDRQLDFILNNIELIKEEFNCEYYIDNNIITLGL